MAAVPRGAENTGSGAIATGGSAAAGAGGAAALGQNAIAIAGNNGQVVIIQPPDDAGALAELITSLRPRVRWPPGGPPRRLRELIGRTAEAEALASHIARGDAVVVSGPEGAGKTTLITEVLNRPAAAGVRDGIVFLERPPGSQRASADDLAQELFDAIWDSGMPHRLVDAETARAALTGIAPIVAVDGDDLAPEERETVARLLPASPVVFVAKAAPFGGALRILGVGALGRSDAVRLLADRAMLDPATMAGPLDAAAALLDDWPGAIATIGDLVGAGRIGLDLANEAMTRADVGQSVPPASAYRRLLAVLKATLAPEEMALLASVAGLAGVSVREDVATEVAELALAGGTPSTSAAEAARRAVDRLVETGVVWRNSPRLRMDGGLREAVLADPPLQAARSGVASFATAGSLVRPAEPLTADDVPLALVLLERASAAGDHRAVAGIARAVDPVLLASGAWDAWDRVLTLAGRAAQAAGDDRERAWVEHERGMRALGLRRTREAGRHLRRAVAIRERLGDATGVHRSRQGLSALRLVPSVLGTTSVIAGIGGGQIAMGVVVLALGVLAVPTVIGLASPGQPTPAPSAAPPPSATALAPSTSPPSAPPASASAPATAVPKLGASATFEAGAVTATGDWTGEVTVTPTGGVPPYTFETGDTKRSDAGSERFAVAARRCQPADLSVTVTAADGSATTVGDKYRPDRCAQFDPPAIPGSGDPAPGTIAFQNCGSSQVGFGPSLAADAESWSLQLQRNDGSAWLPWRAAFNSTAAVGLSLQCGSDYRWRAAAVSPNAWQSQWSDWWTLSLRPTAIPEPLPLELTSCPTTVTLEWKVSAQDGIAGFTIRLHDLSDDGRTSLSASGADRKAESPVTCGHRYEWTVSSVDGQEHEGDPSGTSSFEVPQASGRLDGEPGPVAYRASATDRADRQ